MTKKQIHRAGIIPYIIKDSELHMLFMKPSDPKYGGDVFQIAKGKLEEGETAEQAALREGNEELGLFSGNIEGEVESLGDWLGRTTFFIAKIKDEKMFGEPHFETGETKWMTPEQFTSIGRGLHKSIVKAAVRKIIKTEQVDQDNLINLTEVLDYRPEKIVWEHKGNVLTGKFEVEGNMYGVFFEFGKVGKYNFTNIGFSAYDKNGKEDRNLQNWKSSPYKVLGGVIKGFDEQLDHILKTQDAVVFGVTNQYGEPEKRMKMYTFIARKYAKTFGVLDQNIVTRSGRAQVLYNTDKVDEDQRKEIDDLIKGMST